MLCFGSLNTPCVYLPEDCLLHLLGNDGQRRIAILCLLSCLAKLMVACSKLCSIRHAEFSCYFLCDGALEAFSWSMGHYRNSWEVVAALALSR